MSLHVPLPPFDPNSREADKRHGCGEIWEFPHPEGAPFSLAYCRMKGPSQPHANTAVDELYIPVNGRAVLAIPPFLHLGSTALRPGTSTQVPRGKPHAIIPVSEVVEFYLVTTPPYQETGPDANVMEPAEHGEAGWDDIEWHARLERVAHNRNVPVHRKETTQLDEHIRQLVQSLTVD